MSNLLRCLALVIAFAAPLRASAGLVLELSAGSGARVDPTPVERIQTNVMLTGGYALPVPFTLELQLGLLGTLEDVKESRFDLQLRPMIVVAPPMFPLYLRGVAAVTGLGNSDDQEVVIGGALGARIGLGGLGVFIEAGGIPYKVAVPTETGSRNETVWVAEGRLGGYWN